MSAKQVTAQDFISSTVFVYQEEGDGYVGIAVSDTTKNFDALLSQARQEASDEAHKNALQHWAEEAQAQELLQYLLMKAADIMINIKGDTLNMEVNLGKVGKKCKMVCTLE